MTGKVLEKFIRKKRKMWSNSSSYLVFRSLRRKSSTQLASLKRNKTGAKRVDEVTNNSSISSTALEEPIKVSQTIFPTFSESNEVSFATKRNEVEAPEEDSIELLVFTKLTFFSSWPVAAAGRRQQMVWIMTSVAAEAAARAAATQDEDSTKGVRWSSSNLWSNG